MAQRRLLAAGALVVLAVLGVLGVRYWLWTRWHVTTDDAYVEGHLALITPRVAGTVIEVPVDDNWAVGAGSTLVRLDPTDFRVRLDEATAALDQARQMVDEEIAAVAAARAEVQLAKAELAQAFLELERLSRLHQQKVVSKDELDRAQTAADVARARHQAAQRALERAKAALGRGGTGRYDRAIVRRAAAARDQAALDLQYATIAAPVAGSVTRRAVQVGQQVSVGQPLMAIVPRDLYVIANFKETLLTPVRVAQPVELRVDLYPGIVFRGHVDSIASGTGAVFSLLPPENASGNWVKVVQRVPVKVVLDEQPAAHPLRVGLSVEASVDVSNRNGPLLGSMAQPPSPPGGG
jgi:membrane fusion protein (multidrug efflux system)